MWEVPAGQIIEPKKQRNEGPDISRMKTNFEKSFFFREISNKKTEIVNNST